jgi:membrane protein implicated in regulation of membrane protease activity
MEIGDILTNPAVIWFLAGLVLFALELAAPGLIMVFFGIGAWVTAVVCLIFEPSLNWQLGVFIIVSLFSLLILRNQLKNKFFDADDEAVNALEDEYIGKTAQVIAPIHPTRPGKISFKGTEWSAVSANELKKGNFVRIVSKDSIVLTVEKI